MKRKSWAALFRIWKSNIGTFQCVPAFLCFTLLQTAEFRVFQPATVTCCITTSRCLTVGLWRICSLLVFWERWYQSTCRIFYMQGEESLRSEEHLSEHKLPERTWGGGEPTPLKLRQRTRGRAIGRRAVRTLFRLIYTFPSSIQHFLHSFLSPQRCFLKLDCDPWRCANRRQGARFVSISELFPLRQVKWKL